MTTTALFTHVMMESACVSISGPSDAEKNMHAKWNIQSVKCLHSHKRKRYGQKDAWSLFANQSSLTGTVLQVNEKSFLK